MTQQFKTESLNTSLVATLAVLLLFLGGCAKAKDERPTPEAAKQILKLRGYEFDEKSFFLALGSDDVLAVNAFLAAGMNPNTPGALGITPLMLAVSRDNSPVVNALLKGGADLNAKDNSGRTVLWYAAKLTEPRMAETLLADKRLDVNAQREGAGSILMSYVENGRDELVGKLLLRGAQVNFQDADGDTALHAAAIRGHVKIMRTLFNHGANPNLQNKVGGTPLMWAVSYGRADASQVLLDHGADPGLKDVDGLTAADWALKNKQDGLARLMRQAHGGSSK